MIGPILLLASVLGRDRIKTALESGAKKTLGPHALEQPSVQLALEGTALVLAAGALRGAPARVAIKAGVGALTLAALRDPARTMRAVRSLPEVRRNLIEKVNSLRAAASGSAAKQVSQAGKKVLSRLPGPWKAEPERRLVPPAIPGSAQGD